MPYINASQRVRRSFRQLEKKHWQTRIAGGKGSTELESLILAFKGIQELPPTDADSFFVIAGYHGEPFRGVSSTSSSFLSC